MIAFAINVLDKMTDNSNFVNPDVSMATLEAAIDRLRLAYNRKKNGDGAKIEFTGAVDGLNDLLHWEARYVNTIAKGT